MKKFVIIQNDSSLDPEYYKARASCYFDINDLANGIDDYKKVMERDRTDEIVFRTLFELLFDSGRLNEIVPGAEFRRRTI